MAKDSFEVYYFQNGRWQLHASYEADQRDQAIEEARQVEGKTTFPTRVVRETFFPDTNTSEEAVSWQSPKAKSLGDADTMFGGERAKPKPKRPPPPQRPAPEPQPPPQRTAPKAAKPPARKPKRKKGPKGVITRILTSTLTSVAVAALVALVAALALGQLGIMGVRTPENREQIIFGTFVLVFFIAFLVNLHRNFGLLSMLRGQPKAPAAAAPYRTMTVKPQAPSQDVEFGDTEIESLRAKIAAEDEAAESDGDEETDEPERLDADLDADLGAQVHAAPQAEQPAPKAEERAPQRQPEKPPEKAVEKPPERHVEKPVEKPAAPQKTAAEVEARTGFMKFVGEVMSFVSGIQLNAFSRFGLNLYLAGAASVVGQAKRLARDVQLAVLRDGLQNAGNTPDRAEAFCVELPSYGKNPRYAGMVQAGAKAMNQRMAGSANAAEGVTALLNEWALPEKRPTVPSVITFVFTDIVGSTEMTQRLGNAGAQKAVRAHNTAVRGAIQAKKGREVKHTGDGIMATFPDPASAVTGAVQMQREIAAHNAANPTLQVNVRIGVNVGEAVEEENDFFGAAVQMTARICDKATKGNVWVSQAIVDACKGQRLGFIPRGRFEMKGIQGAKTLYEVGWSDAHKNELADL